MKLEGWMGGSPTELSVYALGTWFGHKGPIYGASQPESDARFHENGGFFVRGGRCRKVTTQTVAPTTGTSNPEELNSGASRFAGKNQTLTGHDL